MTDLADLLSDLIRIDTTNPPGHTEAAVSVVQRLLDENGIASTRYSRDEARPNLVARLQGDGQAPPLLLQAHLDVVPVTDQQWDRDPLGGHIVDDFVWGRGALDMKGPAVMMIDAFIRAHSPDRVPAGDIILCLVSDEEAGGEMGAGYLVKSHPELFTGVRHAVGEFGGFPFLIDDTRFYPIQVSERRGLRVEIAFQGPPGHGSMPVRGGSMAKLGRALTLLDRKHLPVHLTPATRLMLEAMSGHTTGTTKLALTRLLDERTAGATLALLRSKLGVLEPMLRNTVSPTIVAGGDKINVSPARTTLSLDGRLLPGRSPESMRDELVGLLGEDCEISIDPEPSGIPEQPDMTLFDTLASTLRKMDPDGVPIPYLTPAVTDARWFSQLGIQSYGFTPMTLPDGFAFQTTVHGENERIPVDGLKAGADAMTRLLASYGR